MDVHSKRSTYEGIDPQTGEVHQAHRVPNEEVVGKIGSLPSPKRVILEAGRNSWIMRKWLSAVAEEVWIVSPQQVREQLGGKAKTDRRDASALARLTVEGRLQPLWIPDEACVLLRALTRARARLVRQRTATQNAVRALGAQFGYECSHRNVRGKAAKAFWEGVELPAVAEEILDSDCEQLTTYDDRIAALEQQIEQQLASHPVAPLLRTIGGVGPGTSAVFVAEIGDIARFPSPDHLVAYSGLDPSVHQSGDRISHGPVARHGNPFLRTAAVQVAQVQHFVKKDSRLRRNYWRLTLGRKQHPNVAKLDTARKVLKAIYWVWQRKEPYRPLA
jgi:transposase